VTTDYQRAFDSVKIRVEGVSGLTPSAWDRQVFVDRDTSQASIVDTICLVGWSNAFLEVWEHHCAALSSEQLAEIHRHGQRIAEAPEIRLKRSEIVFPGSWRFALASYHQELQTYWSRTSSRG